MMRHHSYCVLTSYEFKRNPFVNSSSLLLEHSPRNNTTQCNTIQYNALQYRGTVQADGVGQDRRTVPPRCRAHARLLGGAGCAQRLHLSPEQTLSILPDTRWLFKYLKVDNLTCSSCDSDSAISVHNFFVLTRFFCQDLCYAIFCHSPFHFQFLSFSHDPCLFLSFFFYFNNFSLLSQCCVHANEILLRRSHWGEVQLSHNTFCYQFPGRHTAPEHFEAENRRCGCEEACCEVDGAHGQHDVHKGHVEGATCWGFKCNLRLRRACKTHCFSE